MTKNNKKRTVKNIILIILIAGIVLLELIPSTVSAAATGTPSGTLAFFLSSNSVVVGAKAIDSDDFDECPIQLNDYGNTDEKCGLWDCTAWSTATVSTGSYCDGGWNCTQWNGVSCTEYKCEGWSSGPLKNLPYCTSGWNCTSWNGNVCGNWDCTSWSNTSSDGQGAYCSGDWNCTSWNGAECSDWNCTLWTIAIEIKTDNYCDGAWDCTAWKGNVCEVWDCAGNWTNAGTKDLLDSYCSDGWNCTAWNGISCDNWDCLNRTKNVGTANDDYSCDRWNCSSWDETKKVCETWDCLEWLVTNDNSNYCSGSFNCTTWKTFAVAAVVSFTLTLPGESPVVANETQNGTTAVMFFNSSTNTNFNIDPCVKSTGTCQNSTVPFFIFENTGNVNLSWTVNLNESLPLEITLQANNVYDGDTATDITPIPYNLSDSVPPSNQSNGYFFADYVLAYPADSTNRTLTHEGVDIET
jgi:hypothetical protein